VTSNVPPFRLLGLQMSEITRFRCDLITTFSLPRLGVARRGLNNLTPDDVQHQSSLGRRSGNRNT
jgi:hypothetical protein